MCERDVKRGAFGSTLAEKQFVQDFIARSRIEIDQARLLTLYAAWQMDTVGKREARQAISMIKVVAANMVMDVLDRAMQVHGSLGVSDDTPLAMLWRGLRMLRLADGPDEVHKMVIALREINRWRVLRRGAGPGGSRPRPDPGRRLRSDLDRGRRAQRVRHRGAEAGAAGQRRSRRRAGDRDVGARQRVRRGVTQVPRAARGRRV